MRNLLLTLAYNGSRYHGFQVQENALSVCQVFQDGLEKVFGSRLNIKGCSRTDAGVHANAYCLSMRAPGRIPCDRLVEALNANLPKDIAVTGCREVPADFHARYSCRGKEYIYKLHNSRIRNPFWEGLVYQYPTPVDAKLLHEQAGDFVGNYDFTSFSSIKGKEGDKSRTITSFEVRREGDLVLFTVSGDGFLYNMVRIMVGTLLFIGAEKLEKGSIHRILAAKDRRLAGKTVPSSGLYLNRVFYDESDLMMV